jgi:hypothetical protein
MFVTWYVNIGIEWTLWTLTNAIEFEIWNLWILWISDYEREFKCCQCALLKIIVILLWLFSKKLLTLWNNIKFWNNCELSPPNSQEIHPNWRHNLIISLPLKTSKMWWHFYASAWAHDLIRLHIQGKKVQ